MRGIYQFDDGIACFQMQLLAVLGDNGELPAEQDAGVDYRVMVSVQLCSCRYLDAQDGDFGLPFGVFGQINAIPALRGFRKFADDSCRLAFGLSVGCRRAGSLQEKDKE